MKKIFCSASKVLICLFCCALFPCLQGQQPFLLLHSKEKTGILSARGDMLQMIASETDYLQAAAEKGRIVYRPEANSPWRIIELSWNKTGLELTPGNVPAELTPSGVFPAFSPDGGKLFWCVYGNGMTELFLWDYAENKIILTRKIKGYAYLPSWSPDSRKIAFYLTEKSEMITQDDYGLAVFDMERNRIRTFPVSLRTRMSHQRDWKPLWSPNSKFVFYEGRYQESVRKFEILLDTDTGKLYPCDVGLWLNNAELLYLFPGPAPYNSLVVSVCPVESIMKGEQNSTRPIGKINADFLNACVFDHHAKVLYYQKTNRSVAAYSLEDKEERILLKKFDFNVRDMTLLQVRSDDPFTGIRKAKIVSAK